MSPLFLATLAALLVAEALRDATDRLPRWSRRCAPRGHGRRAPAAGKTIAMAAPLPCHSEKTIRTAKSAQNLVVVHQRTRRMHAR
jgi:hypothetical protein